MGGKAGLDVAFDIFHHDDGVVDHDADGQHETEQLSALIEKPNRVA
jgi:hypothetical protein